MQVSCPLGFIFSCVQDLEWVQKEMGTAAEGMVGWRQLPRPSTVRPEVSQVGFVDSFSSSAGGFANASYFENAGKK